MILGEQEKWMCTLIVDKNNYEDRVGVRGQYKREKCAEKEIMTRRRDRERMWNSCILTHVVCEFFLYDGIWKRC